MDYKKKISELLKIEGCSESEIYDMIVPPKDTKLCDLCIPIFRFSKQLKKSPVLIAEEIKNSIKKPDFLEKIEAVSGYLNFTLDKSFYIKDVLDKVSAEGSDYGRSDEGKGQVICLDYSSINIAKPFHIGHLSTTAIGAALYRIYEFTGYKSIGINHLGDWGTQFGKLIVAYKLWGDKETIEKGGVREMLKIYVKFHEEAEKEENLNNQARGWFKKIEDGNKEALELFNWFKELTLKEVSKVYERLKVRFDSYAGESFYNDKMEPVLKELKDKGLLVKSDDAEVVMLDDMPPCLLRKADGATLYATRDIAAAFYRKKTYDFARCLYVVAYQQNLHFKQWFKVIELMGYDWYKQLEHIPFGMVSYEGQPLSTRKGNVVFLEDVLNKAVEKSLQIICEKNENLENKEETAEKIGVGAVVFSALINNRIKDIDFNYDKVLNFDGETGPYVQYSYVRAKSILRKAEIKGEMNYKALETDLSMELIRKISRFGEVIKDAGKKAEPSILTRFIVDLAQDFNKFYYEQKIIDAEEGDRNARLLLTKSVAVVIKTGLSLLGIDTPEQM